MRRAVSPQTAPGPQRAWDAFGDLGDVDWDLAARTTAVPGLSFPPSRTEPDPDGVAGLIDHSPPLTVLG
jgi:hypothetical protein